MRTIHITEADRDALLKKARKEAGKNSHLKELCRNLEAATIVDATAYPKDMLTVNSAAGLMDCDTREEVICILVLPEDANANMNMVSVLTPLGSALLGRRVGDTVEWPTAKRTKHLVILRMIYQVASSRYVLPVMGSADSRPYLMEQ